MSAPIRPEQFLVEPAPRAAGERRLGTLLALHCRDELLRGARRRFFPHASDREASAALHASLRRYAGGRWRRDRAETACPDRLRGQIEEACWMIMLLRGAVPAERTIRRAIAPIRGPRGGV